MLSTTNPDDLRRRRLVVLAGAGALLVIAFLSYAVLVHRSHPSSSSSTADKPAAGPGSPVETAPVVAELTALRPTGDPDAFARQVTGALFEWDTATLISRADHVEQLIAVADPTGEATPGLVSDLDNYLPTPDAWTELAKYETRQWIAIDSVATPSHVGRSRSAGRRPVVAWDDRPHHPRHPAPHRRLGGRARGIRARRGLHRLHRVRAVVPRVPSAASVDARQAPGLNDGQGRCRRSGRSPPGARQCPARPRRAPQPGGAGPVPPDRLDGDLDHSRPIGSGDIPRRLPPPRGDVGANERLRDAGPPDHRRVQAAHRRRPSRLRAARTSSPLPTAAWRSPAPPRASGTSS